MALSFDNLWVEEQEFEKPVLQKSAMQNRLGN